MDKEFYALVGVVVGALLAGILGVLKDSLAFRRENNGRRKQETLVALRELNKAVETLGSGMTQLFAHAVTSFLAGKFEKAEFTHLRGSLADMEFTVGLHAPDLKADFACVVTKVSAVGVDWVDSILRLAKNDRDTSKLQGIANSLNDVRNEIDVFRGKLLAYTRRTCL